MDGNSSEQPMSSSPKTSNSMMMIVIGVVIVLLVLAGVAFAFKDRLKGMMGGEGTEKTEETAITPQTPAETSEPTNETPVEAMTAEEVTVEYSAAGFSPATVTVKKGTTVKFINKTGKTASIASNPHPVHTDYPAFDQWKSAAKGKDEYDFTFDKVGTWGYHDHLNSEMKGTVVVTE